MLMTSPSFPKLVLNQVAKDIRYLRWAIGGWLLFLLLYGLEQVHGGLPEAWASFDAWFEIGSLWVMVIFVFFFVPPLFFADPVMGVKPFWKARPLNWAGMLLSKILVLLLVIILPILSVLLIASKATGLPGADTIAVLKQVSIVMGLLLLLLAGVSTMSGDWPRFIIGCIACFNLPFIWMVTHKSSVLALEVPIFCVLAILAMLPMIPFAWRSHSRWASCGFWLVSMTVLLVVREPLAHWALTPKLRPISELTGLSDFRFQKPKEGLRPEFSYKVHAPTWLLRGERRTINLHISQVTPITERWVPDQNSEPYSIGSDALDFAEHPALHISRLPYELYLPLGVEFTEAAKQQIAIGFTETYRGARPGFGNSLAAGKIYPVRLELKRISSTLVAEVRLDRPGIYQSHGFTVRVYDTLKPFPSVRITGLRPYIESHHRQFQVMFLADDPNEIFEPFHLAGLVGGGLATVVDDCQELLLRPTGTDQEKYPLPPGKLVIYCYECPEPEHYALDLPVVAEP